MLLLWVEGTNLQLNRGYMARYNEEASAIDMRVVKAIDEVRIQRGVSQEVLGDALGVSFQQIQKYFSGKNRLTIGKYALICESLQKHPSFFFDATTEFTVEESVGNRRQLEVNRNFRKIKSPTMQKRIADLVKEAAK